MKVLKHACNLLPCVINSLTGFYYNSSPGNVLINVLFIYFKIRSYVFNCILNIPVLSVLSNMHYLTYLKCICMFKNDMYCLL